MKALMIMSLLTLAFATVAQANPSSGYKYPGYPEWASKAFEPRK
jgi:amino acid transporter